MGYIDEQNMSPQRQEPINPQPKSFPFISIISILLSLLIVGGGAFYLDRRSSQIKTSNQNTTVLSPTPTTIIPSVLLTNTLTVTSTPTSKLDKNKVKSEIENSTNPKITVEVLDFSPVDNSIVAYLGHDETWNKFGIYFFNSKTKSSTTVYETQKIVGRGGFYMDNVALEFSPSGEAFFVNRTGINFPSFFIINSKGNILYKSDKDLGHATWVSGQKLIYLTSNNTKPQIYNISTNMSEITQLPDNIFHLKANNSGAIILAFSLPKIQMQCESFDLNTFNYPDGTEIKSILNTTLVAQWSNQNSITYEKITGCKKNTGESMSEYSPIIEDQQVYVK